MNQIVKPHAELWGELDGLTDGRLGLVFICIVIDDSHTRLDIGGDNPVGLDKIIPDQPGYAADVIPETVKDDRVGDLKQGLPASPQEIPPGSGTFVQTVRNSDLATSTARLSLTHVRRPDNSWTPDSVRLSFGKHWVAHESSAHFVALDRGRTFVIGEAGRNTCRLQVGAQREWSAIGADDRCSCRCSAPVDLFPGAVPVAWASVVAVTCTHLDPRRDEAGFGAHIEPRAHKRPIGEGNTAGDGALRGKVEVWNELDQHDAFHAIGALGGPNRACDWPG